MLIAAGNINQEYEVIGVVHAVVSRLPAKAGCGKPGALPVHEAYKAATKDLSDAAEASGANGLIHVSYDHRMSAASVASGCGSETRAVFEVYAWGTAIRLP